MKICAKPWKNNTNIYINSLFTLHFPKDRTVVYGLRQRFGAMVWPGGGVLNFLSDPVF